MRYTTWVEKVFEAFVAAADGRYDFSLTQVAEALGLEGFGWEAFAKHEPLGDALVAAAYDLAALDLVNFENVSHGNTVTAFGRDIAEKGIRSLRPEISAITLRPDEEAVLARIYEVTRVEEPDFAGLGGADTDAIAAELWPELDAYNQGMRMRKVLGDLDRKQLITRSLSGPSLLGQRPTYLGVVRISEPDGRDDGLDAGLVDWGEPTPGFDAVEDRLAGLKTRLAAARSADDLSDIGRRCRDIAVDAVAVVFRPEMVPAGTEAPSPQDAKGRLELYITARVGGGEMAEYRDFLRSSLKLAHARTHSARTGYAAAVAAAQGLLSFVRALQAIERSGAE
ncbi:MAG: hypothetical protein EPN50_07085 [Chloroflexota bacterium]|nr:MAG: hypothetical protein EPN50_07085 [Chloroflexota bacterium]